MIIDRKTMTMALMALIQRAGGEVTITIDEVKPLAGHFVGVSCSDDQHVLHLKVTTEAEATALALEDGSPMVILEDGD